MTWPPANLLAHSEGLRKLIDQDRQRYSRFRAYLYPAEPDLWEIVGDMLKARARYYRGEMIRAKRDTQRFVLGEDPQKPNGYGKMVCEWVDRYLADIPGRLEMLEEDSKLLSRAKSDLQAELFTANLELAEALYKGTQQSIIDITNELERITYGG